MNVGAKLTAFAAHHQGNLCVRLQLQKSIDDLHPGTLEIAGPADIGFLVKARFQLDQRRHRLAGFRRFGELAHDRAVLAGAIEGLFYRRDRGGARRLSYELDDDIKAFIGMMDDDVLLPNRRKAIAAEVPNAFGKARVIGGKDEIGALVDDQFLGIVETENSIGRENVRRNGVELFHQEASEIGGHRRIDSKMDRVAAPTSFECRLVKTDEILGLLLDLDLAVAQQSEDALRDDRETRKQVIQEQRDHLFDRQEPDPGSGQTNESVDRGRDQGQRLQPNTIADPLELQRQSKAAIGDKRERMSRINRERRQDRKDLGHEPVFEP